MAMDGRHGEEMDLLAHGPETSRQIQDPASRQLMAANRGRGVIETRIEVEQHAGPPGQFLLQQPASLFVLFERPLGHAGLRVHEEKHLEADAADPAACGLAERVQEAAQVVEVERVAEEERVA